MAGDIILTVYSGNLSIGRIAASQSSEINVLEGSLINAGPGGANIEAEDIVLNIAGTVGTEDKYIYTDMAEDGSIAIIASGDVFVEEVQGDMRIAVINTNGDAYLVAQGSILNVDAVSVNVAGRNLTLSP